MAVAHLNLASFAADACSISLTYDSVTLAVSAVRAVNATPRNCWVQVRNSLIPALVAAGVLAAGVTASFAVPVGALTLTLAVPPTGGAAQLTMAPWQISARYPAA
jgi:hypothetical protein